MIASTAVVTVELDAENATITSFPDGLWWAVVTVTTVGYGDMAPVTAAGTSIAFVLMLGGIGFFGGITANLASFLVKNGGDEPRVADMVRELRSLREEITALREDRGQQ